MAGTTKERLEIACTKLGRVDYREASLLQAKLASARIDGEIGDQLLLLEHPPTYTRGRRAEPSELPFGNNWYRGRGIDIHETNRGGRITYHGPGQLVAYPIVDLAPLGGDVHEYVRLLEQTVIEVLARLGIGASGVDGLTGVWVAGRKIASMGIHVSRGVTTHGLAINANNDLRPFEWIVPCGIEGCRVTSISKETGEAVNMDRLGTAVAQKFARLYGGNVTMQNPKTLAECVTVQGFVWRGSRLSRLSTEATVHMST